MCMPLIIRNPTMPSAAESGRRNWCQKRNRPEEVDMQDLKLMDYFKFDEDDLEANHKGEYSEAQKKRLFKGLFAPKIYFFYKVQGPISIEPYTLDYHAAAKVYYSLHIGIDKGFRVDKDLLDLMTKGDVYAVFYCNATQSAQKGEDSWDKILSVEFI